MYAQVDLNDVITQRLFHDFAGHYNRFDIFSVQFNAGARTTAEQHPGAQPEPQAAAAAKADVISFPDPEAAASRG